MKTNIRTQNDLSLAKSAADARAEKRDARLAVKLARQKLALGVAKYLKFGGTACEMLVISRTNALIAALELVA